MSKLQTYKDKVSGETLYVIFNSASNTTKYYKDEECKIKHRVDGPAVEYGNGGTEIYYQNNKHHRMDGPAITGGNIKYWYVDDVEIDRDYLLNELKYL
jgi:hypothetical protein